LPRDVVRWLQSLDLSFTIRNPKRDLTNGYIVAEIMARYHPKDVQLSAFENGLRLATKVDNWESLYKLFKKKGIAITKDDIDKVIHCAPGYATMFIMKLWSLLTKPKVPMKFAMPQEMMPPSEPLPAYMRETASRRLKDPEIDRVQDTVERTIRAIDTLGYYHEERRSIKAAEAPTLMRHERRLKTGMAGEAQDTLERGMENESVQIDEVAVKAMTGGDARLGAAAGRQRAATGGAPGGGGASAAALGGRAALLKAVCLPNTSAGALAGLQQPALFVKPAADIMRPLVYTIIQENEELSALIDGKKDIVVAFIEQCRWGVLDEVAIRVFETLANRALLLVDTLTKSAPEFWKVWSTFSPALSDFSEASPVFEHVVFLFKRIGSLMREVDPQMTQQLITDLGLPSICRELKRSPEKRECLCEIVFSYTQQDTLNHLLVLRALKEKINDLPIYVTCLACLVTLDAQHGLLDEHLLDLYIYYALTAMQNSQPKIRVAGIHILSTIAICSAQHNSILGLIPSFGALAGDDWWEVQAQVLLLSAHLLNKITQNSQDGGGTYGGPPDEAGSNRGEAMDGGNAMDGGQRDDMDAADPAEALLDIICKLFVVSNSKNVLQVGLSAIVHLLPDYPTLVPMFVSVLLGQPAAYRQRLLMEPEADTSSAMFRRTYVWGKDSRVYEERCISALWPHLDVAKIFAMQLETPDGSLELFEIEHMEVLLASLPERFEAEKAEEWLDIFGKVKKYVFVALIDPKLHVHATQIIKRFWCCPMEQIGSKAIEVSKRTLLMALRLLYGDMDRVKVEEAAVLQFLRELKNHDSTMGMEVTNLLDAFKETHPAEYGQSQLDTVFA